MRFLDLLRGKPSKKVIKKHLRIAIDEITLELSMSPSLSDKEKMEKALYDLYLVALRSNDRIDNKNTESSITQESILDLLNKVNYEEARIREILKKHYVTSNLDSGVLQTYIDQSMEPLAKLGRILLEKVKS